MEHQEPRYSPGKVLRAAAMDAERFKHLRRFHGPEVFAEAVEAAAAMAPDRERKTWRYSLLDICVVRAIQKLCDHGFTVAEATTFATEMREQLKILLSHHGEANPLVGFFRLAGGSPALLKFYLNDTTVDFLTRLRTAGGVVTIIDLDAVIDEVRHALSQIERWS